MSFPPQFEAPSPEELHELLPAYDVLAFIAKGGMGAVYKAHQKSLERNVAIKILPREFGADEDFRRRFGDEAKAMAKLNHPNLIGVYDFGEVDGMPYIVMEFVDGKSLHHSAHGIAIEQKEVARLVTGICEGLTHAHDAGILHRDIKPANILLDSKKRPKIGDFGLARAADDPEGDGLIFGTPAYTAPEVMKDPDSVDKRSDVFSTGVILYELLTGKLPDSTYVPASQIEDVDPRFDKIIRRATHPSPTLRFADAGAMAKEMKVLQVALDKKVATIVTKAPVMSPVAPPTSEEGEAAPVPPPQVQFTTGTNWSLLRNLIIIVLLIGAIYGMYGAYQWKQKDIARQEVERDKEEQRQNQEDLKEAARLRQEREARAARRPTKTINPIREPKVEKPIEALARLKSTLNAGKREEQEFPPGTQVRGSSRFFFVETPLSWQQAAAFAEEHSGHLATCLNEGEQNWLASKIPSNTTVWLGGGATGRTAWGWVDGTPWNVRKPSSSTGNSATLSDLGSIRSKPGGQKFPFYIQWRMDGSNPGSLASQLERLKQSRDSPDPVFPPGVRSYESRRYLIIEKQVSWSEAAAIAQSAHGHLAVPSEETESAFLTTMVNESLPAGTAAWIGGVHNGRSWTWSTGEAWAFASWAPDSPDGDDSLDKAVRLVAGPQGGWDDANPSDDEAAAAYVIEWSNDRSKKTIVASTAGGGAWAALRAKSLKRIQQLEGKYAAKLAENGKDLKWDLDFWHRGLRDNDERTYAPAVARVKAKVQPIGSIDIDQNEIIKLPPRGVEVVKKHLETQRQLKSTLLNASNKLRFAYIKELEAKKTTSQTNGLSSQVRAIENEIEACGKTGQTFLEHFGSGS